MRFTIQSGFDFRKQATDLGVSVWKTPTVMSILVGVLALGIMLIIYFIRLFDDPLYLLASEFLAVMAVLTVGGFVVRALEEIARANKLKSDFIVIASHQMKNPIAQMYWALELLRKKHEITHHNDCEGFLERVEIAATNLKKLADELLNVAKIDKGEQKVNIMRVDMLSIVYSVIANYAYQVEQKKLSIQVSSQEKTHLILCDEKKMFIAIDNLISNAVKYSPENSIVQVVISQEKHTVKLCVLDFGIGIPERQKSQIFEKFFRAENVRLSGIEGTGLGLYLTKRILESMEGSIDFRSSESGGSCFCIHMPKFNE